MKVDPNVYLARQRTQIDRALDKLVRSHAGDGGVSEAMRYSLLGGGKRLRPILFLASVGTFGEPTAPFVRFACGIECIHTYSLIHDDLPAMDNDDVRRGRPTCHCVYGDALAILAGDGLLTLAFELMLGSSEAPPERIVRAASEVSRAAGYAGMVRGQSMDIYYESREIKPPVLRSLHLSKTAALIEASVASGAILAGANERELYAVRRFGRSLGLTFQIIDDILDVTGDEDLTGKRLRKDEGKATYPALFGTEGARILARKETDKALAALSRVPRDTELLRGIAEWALDRQG